MSLYLVFAIMLGIFAVIAFILSFTKKSEGCAEVSGWFAAIAVVCLLAFIYTPSNEKTFTIASTITTTAPETSAEITTVEIDGVTYAVIDDKLYEIIENKGEAKCHFKNF